ncbi:hypothetical protein D3C78_1103140 [compost metagenome]
MLITAAGNPSASSGQHVKRRRHQRTAGNPHLGQQHKGGQQGAGNGAGRVSGIQTPSRLSQLPLCGGQGTHQHRQRTAHEKRRCPHQKKRYQPGKQPYVIIQAREQPG